MFTDWFVMQREKRLAEEQAEARFQQRVGPRLSPHCHRCLAAVEWKERVPADWRLGPNAQYEPGTDTLHACKPKQKLPDYELEQWRKRQNEAEEKKTLRVGGKSVVL